MNNIHNEQWVCYSSNLSINSSRQSHVDNVPSDIIVTKTVKIHLSHQNENNMKTK